jgi:hypothetical protein
LGSTSQSIIRTQCSAKSGHSSMVRGPGSFGPIGRRSAHIRTLLGLRPRAHLDSSGLGPGTWAHLDPWPGSRPLLNRLGLGPGPIRAPWAFWADLYPIYKQTNIQSTNSIVWNSKVRIYRFQKGYVSMFYSVSISDRIKAARRVMNKL